MTKAPPPGPALDGIMDAVALAIDLDSIKFPKGTRLIGNVPPGGALHIVLPNGRRYIFQRVPE